MWTSWQAYDCNKDPDVSTAVTRTYQESCNYKAANTCNRCSTVTPNQYVWWTLESGKTCDQSPDSTKTTIYRASVSSSVCP